jgi:prepilin-type processing-associated H-X9-DG protein
MDENLVGYALNALDADAHAAVEDRLRNRPEEQERLERLRLALAPLAADVEDEEPPPYLVVRTIARIAAHHCRKLPPAPPPIVELAARRGWRWADALIAAGILLCVATLVPTLALRLWHQYQVYSCAGNLHKFHDALIRYGDTHEGALPMVQARSVAGIVVPMLHDAGVLDSDVRVTCTPSGERTPLNRSVQDLEDLCAQRPDEFRAVAQKLSGCYAYTLGYFDGAKLVGIKRSDDGRTPVMADCPPGDAALFVGGNSPNHGSRGQNVLFLDGSVAFCAIRGVGLDGDDIYLDRENRQRAGADRRDTVLGPSGASPWPREEE